MKRLFWVTGICAMLASLAACGGGGGSSSASSTSTASSTSDGSSLAVVDQEVDALRKAPQPLQIPAVAKKPGAGKTAYWISCKYPECEVVDPGLEAAMKSLGWTLKTLKPEQTPEAISAAWTQAVDAKPDAILAVYIFPTSIIKTQLEEADRNGTAVVPAGAAARAGEDGIDASIFAYPFAEANGKAAADWAISDSEGTAHIVALGDTSSPLYRVGLEAAETQVEDTCPECTLANLPIKVTDAGNAGPGEVVSYLQKNPEVDYVLSLENSTLALGVAQAIKAAGLSAKVATVLSTPANLQAVAAGTEAAAIPNELTSLAWRMADVGVRLVEGESLPKELAEPAGSRQIIDSSNVGEVDTEVPWDVPDVESTFLEAWRLK